MLYTAMVRLKTPPLNNTQGLGMSLLENIGADGAKLYRISFITTSGLSMASHLQLSKRHGCAKRLLRVSIACFSPTVKEILSQ